MPLQHNAEVLLLRASVKTSTSQSNPMRELRRIGGGAGRRRCVDALVQTLGDVSIERVLERCETRRSPCHTYPSEKTKTTQPKAVPAADRPAAAGLAAGLEPGRARRSVDALVTNRSDHSSRCASVRAPSSFEHEPETEVPAA